jgi:DNA adenine methylase
MAKPFLKWVGGKTQILEEVLALFPSMKNYHEPFVGGGSVLLGLLSAVAEGKITMTGKVFASDLNPTLIGLYRNVQSRPAELVAAVKLLTADLALSTGSVVNRKPTTIEEARTSAESYYYWIRSRFNTAGMDRTSVSASAMFLFLNKTCFRGLWREGPRGFNVPCGHYKNPTIIDEAHILAVSVLIKDVVFVCQPFAASLAATQPGDFVYLDPPYAPESATSFVGYTTEGFDLEMHKTLFNMTKELAPRGVRILMSNADVALVKDAFPAGPYQTKIVSCRRAIHSKEPGTQTNEVLITG